MSSLGIFDKETKTYKKVADLSKPAVIDSSMSDTSTNPVQNKVIKKYVDEKQVNIDGITLTLDEAKNVIKLADTLRDKIGSALQPESIVNNQITTEGGFALDARQANPNIDGTLAKQISDLNGSLKEIELTRYNIEGIDMSNTQCFVKNNIAYIKIDVYYNPKEAMYGWVKIADNLPFSAYKDGFYAHLESNDASVIVGIRINNKGELLVIGSTVSFPKNIIKVISYPIA